jgi:ABC-2 type transport system permease protein
MFKNKQLLFWPLIFPYILGFLFFVAFSNLSENSSFKPIKVAVVSEDLVYNSIISELKDTLDVTFTNEVDANKSLENNEIDGILYPDKLVIKTDGINQTILKFISDSIVQNKDIKDLSALTKNYTSNIGKKTDLAMVEFYSLLAMTALYAFMYGIFIINNLLANMSSLGARLSLVPISKTKMLISSIMAGFTIVGVSMIILIFFSKYVWGVTFNHLFLTIILCLTGSLAGMILGIFIGLIKLNKNVKFGLGIGLIMFFSTLAGLTGPQVKYLVDTHMPIINYINPVSMIASGLYALYYHNSVNLFMFSFVSLIIFITVFLIISIINLRSKKYDSI